MNIQVVDEIVNPEDVDLKSFTGQDRLCELLWKDKDKLYPQVHAMLITIAKDFMKDLGLENIAYKDITVTGSLANYNWSNKYSDIDLHIIMDTSRISNRKEFIEKYLKISRAKWNDDHAITIEGFPVEAYIQDINEPHDSTGVYSLIDRKWIVEPSRDSFDYNEMDDEEIRKKAAEFSTEIEEIEERFSGASGRQEIKDIYKTASRLLEKIKNYRSKAKGKDNFELSTNNIVFKYLRRYGRIEALSDIIKKSYDISHSYKSKGLEE